MFSAFYTNHDSGPILHGEEDTILAFGTTSARFLVSFTIIIGFSTMVDLVSHQ